MRKLFFLSLLLTLLTVACALLAVWLRPSPSPSPAADAAAALTVLQGGKLRETTMAEYLPGVVAGEMPASFEPEALKAQAVAARTYLTEHRQNRPAAHPEADVCDDPGCCCAYQPDAALKTLWGADYAANAGKIAAAVQATDGEMLTYGGAPILAAFHASSAGRTESSAALWGAVPYLVSVETPETAADVPNYCSEVTLSAEALRAAVLQARPEAVLPDDPAAWLGACEQDASGRVAALAIGSETFTGAEVRALLSLASAAFTAEYQDGAFRFSVTGHGHGVGMSQYGANVLAGQGAGYREILAHYYPGAVLQIPGLV